MFPVSEAALFASMSAQMPADPADRYIVHPAEDDWCVWDTARDEILFGAERLMEGRARALARRLNEAYRGITQEQDRGIVLNHSR